MAKKKGAKATQRPKKTTPEIRGLLCLCSAILLFLSLISFAQGAAGNNLLGFSGAAFGFLLHAFLGLPSYLLCIYLGWIGWRLLFQKSLNHLALKTGYVTLLLFSLAILLTIVEIENPTFTKQLFTFFYPGKNKSTFTYHLGGSPFFYLYKDLPYLSVEKAVSWFGATVIFSSLALASILFLCKCSPWAIYTRLKIAAAAAKTRPLVEEKRFTPAAPPLSTTPPSEALRYFTARNSPTQISPSLEATPKIRPTLSKKSPTPSISTTVSSSHSPPQEPPVSVNGYQLPPLSLLTHAKKIDQTHLKQNLKKQAEVLGETLLSFGIESTIGDIHCGPTITSFEVHPAVGVKVQRIKALENDIALNMEAKSLRIIAPIPGKAAVGVEVPNLQPQEVGFKEMLANYAQSNQRCRIPLFLGKAVNGDDVISDLTKWPHCIIAGATGSGKSVCINTIVMSLVTMLRPDQLRMLMVDPKKVELTAYSQLPHMLAPVITEPKDACAALNYLVREMEKRYALLKAVGARNIDGFNSRTIDIEKEKEAPLEIPASLPYIVGIIDELADLMMVASQDIETPIARIAQMARAVGIHLILATQRPSREVITGLIKANFPTRISFKVASRVNSQIVLDEIGAEALLGNGDMLFLPPGSSHLIRAQGAYIKDEDIHAVIRFVCSQAPTQYAIPSFSALEELPEMVDPEDDLYQQAKEVVLSTGNASTTFLQRKLKIGYARAASLMDALEKRQIVGPADGAKSRKVFFPKPHSSQDPP